MKSFLPFVTIALVFSSCTAAYNSGQTPDDVYFSPQRPQDERSQNEYVQMGSKKERYGYNRNEETEDDRYLRMKVRNRRMWSDLDYYYNDPIAYNYYYHRNYYNNYNNYYSSPWNYYSSWNFYHNPYSLYNPYTNGGYYGKPVYVVTPSRQQQINTPRQYNLNVYDRNNSGTGSPRMNTTNNTKNRVFSSNNSQPNYNTPNRDAGSNLRNVFGNASSSSSSNNNSTPVRTEPSSSNSNSNNSSSGSSRSSSTAPVRKF